MNARIATFERMWSATVLPRPPLVRQTNRHCLLSEADLVLWSSSNSSEERDRIIYENDLRLEADQRRRDSGIFTQEEMEDIADFNLHTQEEGGVPAPLIHNPLEYYDPDADEPYDMDYAAY